jgi:hypothetical protein
MTEIYTQKDGSTPYNLTGLSVDILKICVWENEPDDSFPCPIAKF